MDAQPPEPNIPTTTPTTPDEHPRWMHHITSRIVVTWMVAITVLLAVEAGFLYYKNLQLEQQINALKSPPAVISSTPTPEPITTVFPTTAPYTCPANGWVDCMPDPRAGVKYECTPEAMSWYKANCPNFQGGAL